MYSASPENPLMHWVC